jgi:hypothetical protein
VAASDVDRGRAAGLRVADESLGPRRLHITILKPVGPECRVGSTDGPTKPETLLARLAKERVPGEITLHTDEMRALRLALRLYLIAGFTCLSLGVPDVPTLQDVMRVKLDSKLCVRTLNRTGQVRACSAPPRIPTVRYRRSPPRELIYPARSGLHLPLRVRVPHRSVAT